MKLSTLCVLSQEEIEQIHEASIDILRPCGVKIYNEKMLDFLNSKGLEVDREDQVVHQDASVHGSAVARRRCADAAVVAKDQQVEKGRKSPQRQQTEQRVEGDKHPIDHRGYRRSAGRAVRRTTFVRGISS